MTQMELYGGSAPHVAGSETSEAAGKSVDRLSMRQKVYALIAARSVNTCFGVAGGVTDDQIEQDLDILHQTASARRRELVLLGKVKDSGRRRRTRSGRLATVWVEST